MSDYFTEDINSSLKKLAVVKLRLQNMAYNARDLREYTLASVLQSMSEDVKNIEHDIVKTCNRKIKSEEI
jgi:hypothetical protein